MWFNRKPSNRRLKREYVLDVKLRSSQVRAARLRLAAVALGVIFAAVFAVCLLWWAGGFTLDRLVYANPAFAIKAIEVETDGVIAVDHLRRWAGVRKGDNLLALDLARVKRDLELVPAIESASVERILPNRVRIRIVEREPVAQVNVPRPRPGGGVEIGNYQLDPLGFIMLPVDIRQRASLPTEDESRLPVVAGINPNDIQAGRRVETPQLRAALELIRAFAGSAMAGLAELKRIDVSSPGVLVVTTGQGAEVVFGLDDFDLQLRRWRAIYEEGQKHGRALAWLDLAITKNIPARWMEASLAPAAPAPHPKPLRHRKRNV